MKDRRERWVVHASGTREIRVLYVGGVPRSGSTLSDLLIDQLPGHVAVGELFYLFRNGVQLNSLCGCGEPFGACPFWREVGQVAFGGWDQLDVYHVLRLQARVDRTSAIPMLVAPRRPSSYDAELAEYTDLLVRIYSAVLQVSGGSVVVDSSKRPSMAYVLRRSKDIALSCVQVVRDPRAVAFSFSKVVELPADSDAGEIMPRSTPRKVGRRWVTVNGLVRALGRLGVPRLTVRYEDLATDPRRELRRVATLQQVRREDLDESFLTDEGMRAGRAHLVAGGRIRLVDGVLPIRLDEEWRRSMAPGTRRMVSAITAVSRRRYGYAG
jgi:hypothetical protein